MYVEPRKMEQMNQFAGQKLRDVENKLMDTKGGEPQGGGGGMNWSLGLTCIH